MELAGIDTVISQLEADIEAVKESGTVAKEGIYIDVSANKANKLYARERLHSTHHRALGANGSDKHRSAQEAVDRRDRLKKIEQLLEVAHGLAASYASLPVIGGIFANVD